MTTRSGVSHFVFSDIYADATAGIFVQLAEHLAAAGNAVTFLHPRPTGRTDLLQRFAAIGATCREVPELESRSHYRAASGIRRAVLDAGIDKPINIACESVPMRAAAILATRHGWHAVFYFLLLRSESTFRSVLRERYDAWLFRRSGGVVLGCSWGICEHLIEHLGLHADKVLHVPNWIDAIRFSPAAQITLPPVAAAAESESAIPTFAYAAAFRPVKQQDILVKLAAEMRARGRRIRIQLVGAADRVQHQGYFTMCESLARDLDVADDVLFLGHRSDVPDILRRASGVLFPSRQEGLACALLEGMAVGLPVAAAAIHSACQLIDDGQNGFLFPIGDVRALADTVERVLDLDTQARRRIGEAARSTVLRHYTAETTIPLALAALGRAGIPCGV